MINGVHSVDGNLLVIKIPIISKNNFLDKNSYETYLSPLYETMLSSYSQTNISNLSPLGFGWVTIIGTKEINNPFVVSAISSLKEYEEINAGV